MSRKSILFTSFGLTIFFLGSFALVSQIHHQEVTAEVTQAQANPTIDEALKKFSSVQKFDAFVKENGLSDATFIIGQDGDGWLWSSIPNYSGVISYVTDTSGKVLDSYSSNDSRGATVAQIKAALTARESAQ